MTTNHKSTPLRKGLLAIVCLSVTLPLTATPSQATDVLECNDDIACIIAEVLSQDPCTISDDYDGDWAFIALGARDPVQPGATYDASWTIKEAGLKEGGGECVGAGGYSCTITVSDGSAFSLTVAKGEDWGNGAGEYKGVALNIIGDCSDDGAWIWSNTPPQSVYSLVKGSTV